METEGGSQRIRDQLLAVFTRGGWGVDILSEKRKSTHIRNVFTVKMD